MSNAGYQIVQLASGVNSVRSLAEKETFHPVIGPVAEAEALYVKQLHLIERVRQQEGAFVVWDVGLGAGANALTVLRATRRIPCSIRLLSFDHTVEPLIFALHHKTALGYFDGYEEPCQQLIRRQQVTFKDENQIVEWELRQGDFPTLLDEPLAQDWPKPNAILFDPFSPARNPAMWRQSLFTTLFGLLDPAKPCALPTYSRSTMLRVTLLLAGFFVGAGHPTGEKEETTIAANTLDLITEPLDHRWLRRARNSTGAEPLCEPSYRQAPLSPETWERLQNHPQFK
jgi:hypothetical protein